MFPDLVFSLLALGAGLSLADAKDVFAHVIVGNNAAYNMGMSFLHSCSKFRLVAHTKLIGDWYNDIHAAAAAGIDGFALNIGADSYTDQQLDLAYNASAWYGNNFKLFLSFDYAVASWSPQTVINKINNYSRRSPQYKYNNKPLVSTFEGPANAGDWGNIKAQTGAFFVPDYSSQGPTAAAAKPNVDGLLSWGEAWPNGPNDITNTADKQYMTALAGKPYMMPVSPWFFTNLPEYNKNWLWRGGDLWHQRWQEAINLQPALIEIISWNDYGESHFVGPKSPYESSIPPNGNWYTDPVVHNAWLNDLPYYIHQYKNNGAPPLAGAYTQHITYWYRLNPAGAGSANGTVCNAPYQTPYAPGQCDVDAVYFSVFSNGSPTVTVQIGNSAPTILNPTSCGGGVFHSSVPFNGQTGPVKISAHASDGTNLGPSTGPAITTSCTNGNVNWNAWVGGT